MTGVQTCALPIFILARRMPFTAYYDPNLDYYVVKFHDAAFPDVQKENAAGTRNWGMFTHGICCCKMHGALQFHQIAITGRHLGAPKESSLLTRLEQAERILRLMGQKAAEDAPQSSTVFQCLTAADTIAQEKVDILNALLTSFDLQKDIKA